MADDPTPGAPRRRRRKPVVVNVTVPEITIEPAKVVVNLPEPKPVRRQIDILYDADGEPCGATVTEG